MLTPEESFPPPVGDTSGDMPQATAAYCPKCGVQTKTVERDPDVFEARCPQCGDWVYPDDSEAPCPDCDHEPEDHDTRGCRGYTPAWPRLVRCGCTQTLVPDFCTGCGEPQCDGRCGPR